MMESEGLNKQSIHAIAAKMMAEFDKAHKCCICESPISLVVKMDGIDTALCVGCIGVISARIQEFDENTLKDIKKNRKG